MAEPLAIARFGWGEVGPRLRAGRGWQRLSKCGVAVTPPRTACGSREPSFALPLQGRVTSRLLRVVASFLTGKYLLGDQARVLPDRRLDAGCDVGIVAQERFCVLAALADALAVMGEP